MLEIEKLRLNKTESNSYFVKQSCIYSGDDYWDWSVWIESNDSARLDKISSVTYHLHKTFPDPVRIIKDRETNFRLDSSGWGEFMIYILVTLKGNTVIELEHYLKLNAPRKMKTIKK